MANQIINTFEETLTEVRHFVPKMLAGIIMISGTGAALSSPTGGTIFSETAITASAFDWKDAAKDAVKQNASDAIDKGLDALTSQIPYIGNSLKGPLGDMIKDAFGLSPEKPMTNEQISQQITELSDQMKNMEASLKAHVDEKTWMIIEEIKNEDVVKTYKQGMDALKNGAGTSMNSLNELYKINNATGEYEYNDDERLLMVATSICSSDTWSNSSTVISYLKTVGGYMMGENYISDKDFYTALCDSKNQQRNCMFYDDVQKASDTYITYMMKDYLTIYSFTVQALKAQMTILDAIDAGDTATFDPANLRPTFRKRLDYFSSLRNEVESMQRELADLLFGNGEEDSKSIVSVYGEFAKHGRSEFINYGNDSASLEYGTRTITGEGSIYTSVFNNNYITDNAEKRVLRQAIENARENGQSIADYLAAHNNRVPDDAQWLIADSSVKRVMTQKLHDDANSKSEVWTDFVTAIDLRDPEAKLQQVPVKSFKRYTWYILGIKSKTEDYDTEYFTNKCLTITKIFSDESNPFGQLKDDKYQIDSGIYRLGRNLVIDGSIVVKDGANVTIDLNGHKLNRSLSSAASSGSVIVAGRNSKVKVIDSNPNGGGTITGGYNKDQAGAMFIYENADVTLENVTFDGNRANKTGGAVLCYGTLNVKNCSFTNNSSADGGAIYVEKSGTLNVTGATTFRGNSTNKYGGGAIANHGKLNISGTAVFEDNTSKENGGAIWSTYSTKIDGARIVGNKTGGCGGGISVDRKCGNNQVCEISNCVIQNNAASGSGGGIHSHAEIHGAKITNCKIAGNKAGTHGGGVMIGQNSNCYIFDVTFKGCTITGNHANGDGGGVNTWQGDKDKMQKIRFEDCTISDNSSNGWGGGYRTQANVEMTRCQITNNNANKSGGGIYNHAFLELRDCLVTGNRANSSGGGISHAESSSGYGYTGNTHIDLYGSTRIENNFANGKESSIFEVGKKADVHVHDEAYIGPGYHIG